MCLALNLLTDRNFGIKQTFESIINCLQVICLKICQKLSPTRREISHKIAFFLSSTIDADIATQFKLLFRSSSTRCLREAKMSAIKNYAVKLRFLWWKIVKCSRADDSDAIFYCSLFRITALDCSPPSHELSKHSKITTLEKKK